MVRKICAAVSVCVALLLPAAAEPFYGPLDREVDAFIGSYAYVSWGAGADAETIRAAREKCDVAMPDSQVPPTYANGDFAFYRDDAEEFWIEGPRIGGRYKVTAISDDVADVRSNFTFSYSDDGLGGTVSVELAHFHREPDVWPGVLLEGNSRLSGVWVTCSSLVDRPVAGD